MDLHYFKNRNEWHNWLQLNHESLDELWVVYYKKDSGKSGISYQETLEEAICFGWIDGLIRKIDDERYVRRFTQRRAKSVWSQINKKMALRLISENKMTALGYRKIEEAKANGKWDKAYNLKDKPTLPDDLKIELQKDQKAWSNFNNFSNSIQARYIFWIDDAKRIETRQKRIMEVVKLSENNIKPSI